MDFFNGIKYWIISILIILLIIANISISIYFNYYKEPIKEEIIELEEKEEPIVENTFYYVDIKGAVANPGVYLVNKGTIINDVINLAGGLTRYASTKYLNLSKSTSKEMVIYIYTINELQELDTKKEAIKETCNCPKEEIKECIEQKISIIENKPSTKEDIPSTNEEPTNIEVPSTKININTATKEELMTLSGIGESKAIAIIEYRTNNGLFQSIEDIKNVSGIGDSAFEKIKDYITI